MPSTQLSRNRGPNSFPSEGGKVRSWGNLFLSPCPWGAIPFSPSVEISRQTPQASEDIWKTRELEFRMMGHTYNWLPPGEALHQASVSVQLEHHLVSRTPGQSSPKCPLPPVQPQVPGTAQSAEFTLRKSSALHSAIPICILTAESPALTTSCPPPTRNNSPTCKRSLGEQRGIWEQRCYTQGFGGGGRLGDEALTQTLPFIFKAGYKTQPKEQWGNTQGPRRKDGVCRAGFEHSVASFPTFSGAGCWWAEKEALLSPETRRDSGVMFHHISPEPMSGVSPVPSVPSPTSLRGSQTGGKWSSWDFWVRFRKEASAQNSEAWLKQCLGTSPSEAGVTSICFSS